MAQDVHFFIVFVAIQIPVLIMFSAWFICCAIVF